MMMLGVQIAPHPAALTVRHEWRVERHPTPKKRRNWQVVKHRIEQPGAYLASGTLYIHPDLVEKLPGA